MACFLATASAPGAAMADAIGQLCSAAGAANCPGAPTLRGLERPGRPVVERPEPCLECQRWRAEALARMAHLPPEVEHPVVTDDEIARAVAAQIERDDRKKLERLTKIRAALSLLRTDPPEFLTIRRSREEKKEGEMHVGSWVVLSFCPEPLLLSMRTVAIEFFGMRQPRSVWQHRRRCNDLQAYARLTEYGHGIPR